MPNISHLTLTRPRVLWDNAARFSGVTSVYSGTITPGFDLANAIDWLDWSLFRPDSGVTSSIEYTLPDGATLDCWGMYFKVIALTIFRVEISYNNGGGFIVVDSFEIDQFTVNPPSLFLQTFNEVTVDPGGIVRIQFIMNAGTEVDIRQLAFGQELLFPMGQHQGVKPTTLTFGVVRTNRVSVNGSVLGSDFKRNEKMQEINLEYLDPDYYRSDIEPFVQHMIRYACFYQWAPTKYPAEVGFSVAESIMNPTQNNSARGKMNLTMPLRSLTE